MLVMKLPKEQKDQLAARIQQYFELERSETIGSIAAEQLLDFMIQEIGPHVYNHAIQGKRTEETAELRTSFMRWRSGL